jgi:hypothetical protein
MRKIIDWPQHPLCKNSYDQTLLLSRSTAVPSSSINFKPQTFHQCSDKCAERYYLFINPSLMFKPLQINQAMKTSTAHQSSSFDIFGVWSFADVPSASPITRTFSHIFKHLQNNQAMKISSAHQSSSFDIFGVWSFADAPSASQLNHTHLLSHLQSLAEQSNYEIFISPPELIFRHFWRLKLR